MGATNHGTQNIVYEYYEEMTSEEVNSRHVGIRPRGIYSGGYLTKISNVEITISPMVVELGDSNTQVRVKTSVSATLNSGTLDSGEILSSTPYIILRRLHVGSVTNYMEIRAISSLSAAQATDVVVGKCVFDGATLTGFDYSDRTFLNVQDLFLKVESTIASEMYVRLRAGKIQNDAGYVFIPEQKVGPFAVPGSSNSRIDLVYIDTDGTAKILQGVAAVSPSAPSYGGKTVVAQVRLVNGDSNISSDRITDVRSFIVSIPATVGFGNWTKKDSGGASLTRDIVYKATSDGLVIANSRGNRPHLDAYTHSDKTKVSEKHTDAHKIEEAVSDESGYRHLLLPVRKDDYWKIVGTGMYATAANFIWWLPMGDGACVKQ